MKKLLFLLVLSTAFIACSKEKDDSPPDSIVGFWVGKWTRKGNSKEFEMSVVLRENGSARVIYGYDGTDTASALYVTEDQFLYSKEDGKVEFESRESAWDLYAYRGQVRGNSMSGTWGTIPSVDNGGNWNMKKK